MLHTRYNGHITDHVAYSHDPADTHNPFRFYDLTRENNNPHLGTTNFFRHPSFFHWLSDRVRQWDVSSEPRILAAPCCVGAETYSLAAVFERTGCFQRFPRLNIHTFDISDEFTKAARQGRYPVTMAAHIPAAYRTYFTMNERHITVDAAIKKRVRILSPKDLTQTLTLRPYDIVMSSNVLMHLKDDAQKCDMLDNLSSLTGSLLCLNNIAQDARRNVLLFHRRLEKHGFRHIPSPAHESLSVFERRIGPKVH